MTGKRTLTHKKEQHLMVKGECHFYADLPYVLSISFDFLCGNDSLQDVFIHSALNNYPNFKVLMVRMSKMWLKIICAPFDGQWSQLIELSGCKIYSLTIYKPKKVMPVSYRLVDKGFEADQQFFDQVQLYLMYKAALFNWHFKMPVKS